MQQSSSSKRRRFNLAHPRFLLTVAISMSLIAAGLFLVPLSSVAEAKPEQSFNVKLNARSFYNGNFKYGDWLPVEVSLENYGEALDGYVEATISSFYNGNTTNTTFRREVSLGQRANKRFTLYIQPFVQTTNVSRQVSYEAKIQLKAADQKIDEKIVTIQPINPQDYLMGALVNDPNAVNGLNNLKVGAQRGRVTAVPLTLSDIPDRMEGLRSLNSLVISETATDGLSGAQRNALRNWVSSGGQLILMGGNGWGRVREAFDSSFLPFDVLDFVNVTDVSNMLSVPGDKSPLSRPIAMARGQVLEGARALAYTPSNGNAAPSPLIVERRVGGGRVLALAVDLTNPTLLDWSGTNRVWQDLLGYNAGTYNALYAEQNPQLKNSADLLAFISSVPELQVPTLVPFLLIFTIYVLVIGPLNYLILKRLGRLEWAWATIPVSIAIGTVFTVSVANSQPPGQVIVNQMSVIQISPGQESAQVRSYAAVFSPEDRRYQIALEPQEGSNSSLFLPMLRTNTANPGETEAARIVVEGDRARLDGFPIGQWAAQGMSAEAVLPARNFQLNSALSFQRDSAQQDNSKIVGTIRNTTGTTIRNAVLIYGDSPIKLKDVIEPGESVPVEFALPSPTAMAQAYCSNSYGSYGSFPPQTVGDRLANLFRQDRNDRREDKLLANRAGFLKKVFDSGRYSPLNPTRGLDFVGWIDQNPLPLSIDGVTVDDKTSQVLIARLPVSNDVSNSDARLFVPGPVLWPESANNDAGLSPLTNRADRLDEVCLNKGNVTALYRLPVEQGQVRASRITLYVNSINASSQRTPNLPDRIEFYEWQTGKWQTMNGLTNSAVVTPSGNFSPPPPKPNEIPEPTRFVDPLTGRILVRFSEDGNGTLLTQFNLAVEVSR